MSKNLEYETGFRVLALVVKDGQAQSQNMFLPTEQTAFKLDHPNVGKTESDQLFQAWLELPEGPFKEIDAPVIEALEAEKLASQIFFPGDRSQDGGSD